MKRTLNPVAASVLAADPPCLLVLPKAAMSLGPRAMVVEVFTTSTLGPVNVATDAFSPCG